jgi:hypothetical protein
LTRAASAGGFGMKETFFALRGSSGLELLLLKISI